MELPSKRYQQADSVADYVFERLKLPLQTALRNATHCCPNCEHFDAFKEACKLNGQRPPATIIAFGCEMFQDNQVPF